MDFAIRHKDWTMGLEKGSIVRWQETGLEKGRRGLSDRLVSRFLIYYIAEMGYYMSEYFQNFNHLIKIYIQCIIQNSQTSKWFCCLLYPHTGVVVVH